MKGFFIVDKPKGITSQGVVNYIKKKFNLKKCGHNGTLDPNATGVMVVACNDATKLMKFLNEHDKEYIATICFGYTSNTLDIWGSVIEHSTMSFSLNELDQALNTLKNQESQIPPMVSAIKINGKKLYEYERANQEVNVEARKIKIYELARISPLIEIDGHLEVEIRIHCSKGFYVRSFARDLGNALGGAAVLKALRRTRSGNFSIEQAIPLKDLESKEMLSISTLFPDFSYLEVDNFTAKLASNGVMFDERQIKTDKPFYVTHKNAIIAIYECVDTYRYKPLIVFKK